MTMNQCKHCQEVNQNFRIESPGDLTSAIRVIAGNLADGTIVENKEDSMESSTSFPFSSLSEGELWDDIIEYYFKCPKCGLGFSLIAETYHGSGGNWSPQTK
jgi:hypothetical protein